MREFHGRDAYDGTDTGTDSGADAPERHADDSGRQGRAIAETRDTAYGPSHRVLSGLTGPNGRDATLVTCWLIEDRSGISFPKITTTWVQPHCDKETER
jgi:hypothetical protein